MRRAELVERAAINVRGGLPGHDLIALTAILHSCSDVDRSGQAGVESAREVNIRGVLLIGERACVERRLIGRHGRAKRHVERVANEKVEFVAPVAGAGVVEPRSQLAANPRIRRPIGDARLDQRKESQRIDLRPIGGIDGPPVIPAVGSVTETVTTERVEDLFAIFGDREIEVKQRHEVASVVVAPMRVRLRYRILSGVPFDDLIPWVGKGAIRGIPVAILDRAEESAARNLPATAEIRVEHLAVGMRGRSPFDLQPERLGVGFQNQVEHAGDSVRTVLRRRAVAKDLHALDRRCRDGIEIHAGRSATNCAVDVYQRAHVSALAIHHHQDLIGSQSAQSRRADAVRAIGNRRSRKIERWSDLLDDLTRLRRRCRLDLFARDDIDRHRLLLLRVDGARADGDLLTEGGSHDEILRDVAAGINHGRLGLKAFQRRADLRLPATVDGERQRVVALRIGDGRQPELTDRDSDAGKSGAVVGQRDAAANGLGGQRDRGQYE